MKTSAEKIALIRAHSQRVSELFLERYPSSTDFAKTNRYFWNKCRQQAAIELGIVKP